MLAYIMVDELASKRFLNQWFLNLLSDQAMAAIIDTQGIVKKLEAMVYFYR